MGASRRAAVVGATLVTAWAALSPAIGIPLASAEPCPDIEVVFARGTGAPPGIGLVGDALVNSLRAQVGGRSVGVYAVNYPAGLDFAGSSIAGANDASAHVQETVAACPNTDIVLGGFSQGANVIDLITDAQGPAWGVPTPMPPEVADHVAAVVVFGNPSRRYGSGPLTDISPVYGAKAIDLCMPGDPVCSEGGNLFAHTWYVESGAVDQAAAFVAGRL